MSEKYYFSISPAARCSQWLAINARRPSFRAVERRKKNKKWDSAFPSVRRGSAVPCATLPGRRGNAAVSIGCPHFAGGRENSSSERDRPITPFFASLPGFVSNAPPRAPEAFSSRASIRNLAPFLGMCQFGESFA